MIGLERDILSAGGAVARLLGEAFEPREEQVRMARAVAQAMESRSHLLVEAGTGVGKSFAYLVPAALRCLLHDEIVVVSTHTISLQQQLVDKDIPLVQAAVESFLSERGLLPPDTRLRPALVKGRGNYLSIRRLRLASSRQEKLFADPAAKRTLHAIEDWAYRTRDGTLATLPILERPDVWDRVQSDSGNCMGKRCPTYQQCFYQNARRDMSAANLLVCNHALFFRDLALRADDGGLLPDYHHVILDEGHTVEDAAADQFGLSLSHARVLHLLSTLYQPHHNKGYLLQLGLLSREPQAVEAAVRLVVEVDSVAREFFQSVDEALRRQPGRRVRSPGLVEDSLTPVMRRLSLVLAQLKDAARDEADRYELNAYSLRAAEIADQCYEWIRQTRPGYAYWVEGSEEDRGQSRGRRNITLAAAPVDVAPILRQCLFDAQCSVTVTSATLAIGSADSDDAFAHVSKRLGCEGAETLLLGSPFDYARNVEFYIDLGIPSAGVPAHAEERIDNERYLDALSRRVLHHVNATDGGAFVLFTSLHTLRGVADRLEQPLKERGLPLFVQGRTGSREQILEAFRQSGRGVLLGALSFWEGVDVRGDALRNVIITKLPFEPPHRPLTEARGELIRKRGGNPFIQDALPRAVLRFKQGFGRLIRSKTDCGRVVVLDPRIVRGQYGKAFLDALPAGVTSRLIGSAPSDTHDEDAIPF